MAESNTTSKSKTRTRRITTRTTAGSRKRTSLSFLNICILLCSQNQKALSFTSTSGTSTRYIYPTFAKRNSVRSLHYFSFPFPLFTKSSNDNSNSNNNKNLNNDFKRKRTRKKQERVSLPFPPSNEELELELELALHDIDTDTDTDADTGDIDDIDLQLPPYSSNSRQNITSYSDDDTNTNTHTHQPQPQPQILGDPNKNGHLNLESKDANMNRTVNVNAINNKNNLDGPHKMNQNETQLQKQTPTPTQLQKQKQTQTHAYKKDSLQQFSQDITTVLKVLKADGQDPDIPKLFRNIKMPSFTNVWSRKDWDRHTSRWRYVKYALALPTSRLLRRIAPPLLVSIIWSCIACQLCCGELQLPRQIQGGSSSSRLLISKAVLPLMPLSLISTFVAGLLTLRSNQGLSRLNEGRLAFGKVVLYTRDMAQLIATLIYPRNKALGLLAARHVALFGWLLKDFLRHYDEDYTKVLNPYHLSACHETELIRTMLPNDSDVEYLLRQRKKPVALVTRLRQIFQHIHVHQELSTSEQSRLDSCAQHLNRCIMVCERIRASPIPPLYTAHAGRLLMFYLFFLPLALRGSQMLDSFGTVLTTTAVAYTMLGLDEISHILEEPFRLMPLYHLSKNSMKDVADAMICEPPSLFPMIGGIDDNDDFSIIEYDDFSIDEDDTTSSTSISNSASSAPSYW